MAKRKSKAKPKVVEAEVVSELTAESEPSSAQEVGAPEPELQEASDTVDAPIDEPQPVLEAVATKAVQPVEVVEERQNKQTTEGAKVQEDPARSETMSESKKDFFSWMPNMMNKGASKDVMEQLVKPWMEAMSVSMEHTTKLQQAMFDRTQDAMKESYELMNEGVKQYQAMVQRSNEVVQDQVKRFTS